MVAQVIGRIAPHSSAAELQARKQEQEQAAARAQFMRAIGLVTKRGAPRKLPTCTTQLLAKRAAEAAARKGR